MRGGSEIISKRVLSRAIALLLGCFGALFLAEGFLRISNVWIGRHSDTMFEVIRHDPQLGWRMKPGLQKKIDLVNREDIPVRSNSVGFWDEEFTEKKEPGRCRIAFLGDSFTWGLGVSEEGRFSNLVEAEDPNRESLNFGMPGYGTDQSLLVWRGVASFYQPDLVVLTIYDNDYRDNLYMVRYGRRKPYFELNGDQSLELKGVPVDPKNFWQDGVFNRAAPPYEYLFPEPAEKRSRIIHWFSKNSDLVRFVYTLRRRSEKKADRDEAKPSSALGLLQRLQIKLLAALVGQFSKEIEETGAKFLVVLAGRSHPEHRSLKKILDSKGAPYVDMTTDILAQNLFVKGQRVYYLYSGHWTPNAHQAVANLLAKFIQERDLCDVTG